MRCPCHSGEEYTQCCQPYHGGAAAATPEKLMRSRYSAYALGLVDYILLTQTLSTAREQLSAFCKKTEFRGLEILSVESEHVTFRATLFQGDIDVSFTERSLFKKRGGRWLYVQGKIL